MSDEALRTLARQHGDGELPAERYRRELERRGCGWAREPLPSGVRLDREPGAYYFVLPTQFMIRLVYVPGSLIQKTEPFYIGAFPVLNAEYRRFLIGCEASRENDRRQNGRRSSDGAVNADPSRDMSRDPATGMTHEDAKAFCAWAGLRLPTHAEWTWAALGREVKVFDVCPKCDAGEIEADRDYPWGHAAPGLELPGDAYCVWRPCTCGHPESDHGQARDGYGPDRPCRDCSCIVVDSPNRTEPCLVEECGKHHSGCQGVDCGYAKKLVPARPRGRSWCGAYDMAGHAWEYDSDGRIHGGSYMDGLGDLRVAIGGASGPYQSRGEASADRGFRVALSGVVA